MFKQTLNSKIVKKLLIRALFMAAILICTISAVVGLSTFYHQLRLFEEKTQNIKKSYLDIIRTALWVDDKESLKLALMGIKRITGVGYVDIHFRNEIICKAGDVSEDDSHNRFFPIIQIYNNKHQQLGTLHIAGDQSYIHQQIINAVLISVITQILIIILVSTAMMSVTYRSIIMRILTINNYTVNLKTDSLDQKLTLKTDQQKSDELDDLANSINNMRENLHNAFQKKDQAERRLIKHQKELENIVSLRTASLKAANEKLQNEIDERIAIEHEKEKLIKELKSALSDIKQLSGMLPICSSCKKIRDDKGYWSQVESYIGEHSEAEFSHSICPDCAKKLYPELNLTDEELAENFSDKEE